MTIQDLKDKGLILFECINGSKAYGLNTPESDTDIKGVFILPQSMLYGLNYIPQISNETNDIVYYELGRFIELLVKSNPNILELLNTPEDCILFKHSIMDRIDPAQFLSKQCQYTFGNYAYTQIEKARGLNKKILNPVSKEKKSVLDFCYVTSKSVSLPLKDFLKMKKIRQEDCGLAALSHMNMFFALYHDHEGTYKGILRKESANEVALSSIPKGVDPIAYLYFNKDGYSHYCKDYKQYWEWVEKRNEPRYQNTLIHGKNYDAKNMMHVFRLLHMAEEIGREREIHVRRSDRDYLLSIKRGEFSYEELVSKAETKMGQLKEIYEKSALPDNVDEAKAKDLLVEMRGELYGERNL